MKVSEVSILYIIITITTTTIIITICFWWLSRSEDILYLVSKKLWESEKKNMVDETTIR